MAMVVLNLICGMCDACCMMADDCDGDDDDHGAGETAQKAP
jgi:hypothetical protein